MKNIKKLILCTAIIFLIPKTVISQEEKWKFMGYWTYTEIPNSCKKKADFGMVIIRKNKNYSKNLSEVKQRIKSEFDSFLYTSFYDFTLSQGGVYKLYLINNVCASEDVNWTGYRILAGDPLEIDNKFANHVKNTSGIKSTKTYLTGFLDLWIKGTNKEVITVNGISMNGIGETFYKSNLNKEVGLVNSQSSDHEESSKGEIQKVNKQKSENFQKQNPLQSKIKKPFEYTKNEWKNMTKAQQDESLRFQLDNLFEDNSINTKYEVDNQEQKTGNSQFAQGNYLEASQSFSSAGDYYSATAAAGTLIITEMFDSFKIARDNKIKKLVEKFENILNEIDVESKILNNLYSNGNIEEFIEVSNVLLEKKILALEHGFDLIKKERKENKKKYRKVMGLIFVDIFNQLNYTINNKIFDSNKKLELLESFPLAFNQNEKVIDLLNEQVTNKNDIDKALRNIYLNFIAFNLQNFDVNQRLEIFLMMPLSITSLNKFGLNKEYIFVNFDKLSKIEKQNLFKGFGIRHRINLHQSSLLSNHDLDEKTSMLLKKNLDYHFFLGNISFYRFNARHKLNNSRELLKTKINEDYLASGKPYNHILDEKYIQRKLDTLNSDPDRLNDMIKLDGRLYIFKDLSEVKSRIIIYSNENKLSSFNKNGLSINNNPVPEIGKKNYFSIDITHSKIAFNTRTRKNILTFNATKKIYFIKVDVPKDKSLKTTIKIVEPSEAIRLIGKFKKVEGIKH